MRIVDFVNGKSTTWESISKCKNGRGDPLKQLGETRKQWVILHLLGLERGMIFPPLFEKHRSILNMQNLTYDPSNVGIAIMNHPFLMVGIPPIQMVMSGGWFMTLRYQHDPISPSITINHH